MTPASERPLRIVIINYNTKDLLADCLRSLLADAASSRWHVVVVDNASTDGSAEMVAQRYPGVTLVASQTNRGFSAGNNLGCDGADEEYLLFLNSDTVVPEGSIGKLLEFIESDADCVAVAPRLLSPDGSLQFTCRTFPGPLNTLIEGLWLDRIFPSSAFFGRPRMTWLDHTQTVAVEYAAGAALMMRRGDFEAVGGWPEAYFFYAEDADLCRALSQGGRRVYYLGAVTITHIGGASASQRSLWAIIQATRTTLLFSLRNGGPGKLMLHRTAFVLTTLPRLLGGLVLWPFGAVTGKREAISLRLLKYLHCLLTALSPLGSNASNTGPAQGTRGSGDVKC